MQMNNENLYGPDNGRIEIWTTQANSTAFIVYEGQLNGGTKWQNAFVYTLL